MKLLCVSDIHGNQLAVDWLVAQLKESNASFDAVVVTGDVVSKKALSKSNDNVEFVSIMSKLAEFGEKVFYCLGNWDENVSYVIPELSEKFVHVHHGVTEFRGYYFAGYSGCDFGWGANPIATKMSDSINIKHASILEQYLKQKQCKRLANNTFI